MSLFAVLFTLVSFFYCRFVTAVILDSQGCPQNLPDTTTVRLHHGTCYQFVNNEQYWTDARDYCWKYGGRLVMVNTEEINNFITGVLNSLSSWDNNGVWIGLTDKGKELVWKWVTDSQFHWIPLSGDSWTNWASGHPEGFWHSVRDCIRMVRDENWKWSETPCSTIGWTYKFICQYDQIVPTTVTNKVEPPKMGAVVGSMNVAQTHAAPSLPSMETEEDYTVDNTIHAENIDVTNVILDVEKSHLAASVNEDNNKTLIIVAGSIGAVVVSLLVIIVIVSCRNNRRDKTIEVESAKGVNGSTKLAAPQDNQSRQSNLYECDPVHSERKPIEPPTNDGGYLQPKSLVTATSLKDGYLTTSEAKTGGVSGVSDYLLASAVVPGPCDVAFDSSERQKKLGALPGYISMNGSGQRLNCAVQESCDVGDVTSGYANDYTMPVTEPIYAEIPEVSGEIVKI